ncbi:roadblock/LC7 domain-containing protein [Geobacter pickeringii]|uniref:GTPase n=1 Tax=Geobacter pickeringii TaxID=345632 RepID=A0A0B5BIE2_9BACT|nr:roadblock/LC7 domain-containing protein [Geobacter pickeringii]AJE03811.1 GTPase [Geobacter pickeringii]
MPFKAILTDLVRSVPGASGAILADWEGEAVEQFALYDDFELKIVGAHKGIILNQVKELQGRLDDPVRDAVITTAHQHVVIGAVGNDYSLVMTLAREAISARALPPFRKAIELLMKEIY